MKPTLYLETTIISYLAARRSRDLVVAAHQRITREWWSMRLRDFTVFHSELVAEEAARGDTEAARRRIALLAQFDSVRIDERVASLANSIVRSGCIPEKAGADSVHIALAAVHDLNYLLTWNCTHINNAEIVSRIEEVCKRAGYRCPVICTPEELMGA